MNKTHRNHKKKSVHEFLLSLLWTTRRSTSDPSHTGLREKSHGVRTPVCLSKFLEVSRYPETVKEGRKGIGDPRVHFSLHHSYVLILITDSIIGRNIFFFDSTK